PGGRQRTSVGAASILLPRPGSQGKRGQLVGGNPRCRGRDERLFFLITCGERPSCRSEEASRTTRTPFPIVTHHDKLSSLVAAAILPAPLLADSVSPGGRRFSRPERKAGGPDLPVLLYQNASLDHRAGLSGESASGMVV